MKALKIENLKLDDNQVKEEAGKVSALTADEISNSSFEDILHNISILETAKQVSEKEIAALKVSSGLVALEDAQDKIVEAIKLHLSSIKAEDLAGEELCFGNLTEINEKADKVSCLKSKHSTIYKVCDNFNQDTLYNVSSCARNLLLFVFSKYISKLTATDQRNLINDLTACVNAGYLIKEDSDTVGLVAGPKQLSLEDLDSISLSLASINMEGGAE